MWSVKHWASAIPQFSASTDLQSSSFFLPRTNATTPDGPQRLVVELHIDTIRGDIERKSYGAVCFCHSVHITQQSATVEVTRRFADKPTHGPSIREPLNSGTKLVDRTM